MLIRRMIVLSLVNFSASKKMQLKKRQLTYILEMPFYKSTILLLFYIKVSNRAGRLRGRKKIFS